MFVDRLLTAVMAFLGSAPAVHYSYEKYTCTNPAVRKEWRAITTEEKAEWIRAVHVRIDIRITLIVFLKHHIRNPVLVAAAS
jgi:hypothetical protein